MARERTNIELESTYVEAIMDRYGVRTKTAAVHLALRHLAGQPMTRDEALGMRGAHAIGEPPADVSPARRSTGSSVDRRLAELIESGGPVAVTEPVVMEVLAGARDDRREADLRRLLLTFPLLGFDAMSDFDGAVRIYRRCRTSGVTPRGMVDCMIAAVAWRRGAAILAQDADLGRVAGVVGIEMDEAAAT